MQYYRLLLLMSVTFVLLSACGKASFIQDPAQQYEGYTAEQLYIKGNQKLAARSYKKAVTVYEALQSLYPFGGYAEKGQLNLVYAYYQSGDYASAVAAADQYIRVYPRGQHVDYAYYLKGLSDYYSGRTWVQRAFPVDMSERDLDSAKQAFYDFRRLVQFYPTSYYANDARQRMIYLRNMFAQYELEIAKYYYVRGAYVAAANRATYVIQHFDGTPQARQALDVLIKANQKLGLL